MNLATWTRKYVQVSETTLALTFAEHNGDKWRFNTEEGHWLEWTGNRWARGHTPEFLDALRHFLMVFALAFRQAQRISPAEATKLQSQRSIAAIEKLCRSLPSFLARSVLFDNDPMLLGTPVGVVDLRTGELRPAQPEDYITLLTRVAPAETENCPRWLKFIDEITNGDKDMGEHHKQWSGMNLTGDPSHQKLSFMVGTGRNGKSTLMETLLWILDDYGLATNFEVFVAKHFSQHPTELMSLKGKSMVIASEVPDHAVWNTQRLKDLSGNDTVRARAMRCDEESFPRTFSLTFLLNNRPKFKNVDAAIRGRLLVSMFDRDFVAEGIADPELSKTLKKEAAEILRWALNGLKAVQEAGGQIIMPARVVEETESYLNKYDLQKRFFAECVEKDPEAETLVQDFYKAWEVFAEAKGIDPINERSTSVWLVKLTGAERGRRHVTEDGLRKKLATLKGFKVKEGMGFGQ